MYVCVNMVACILVEGNIKGNMGNVLTAED